jgi:hypothetical protein
MIKAAFLDTSLLAAVALRRTMVAPRLVDAAWLTRGWLSVASTGIPVIRQLGPCDLDGIGPSTSCVS